MAAALLTSILFSFSAVCGHRSSRLIGGVEANFWRATLATVLLAAWSYAVGCGLAGTALPVFLLSGILGIGLGDTAYYQALPRLGSRLTLLLVQCLTAPLGAVVEWLWLGTSLSPRQVLFSLTILLGVAIVLKPGEHLKLTRHELSWGTVFGVVAAIGGAGGAVLSRKAFALLAANGEHIDVVSAGYQRMFGGVLIAGLVLLVVKRRAFRRTGSVARAAAMEISRQKWRGVWPWIVGNSVAGQTLGVSCMQWAFQTTPAAIVLSIIALSPVIVMPMAYWIDGERPTRRMLAGAFIAVSGVIGLTWSR